MALNNRRDFLKSVALTTSALVLTPGGAGVPSLVRAKLQSGAATAEPEPGPVDLSIARWQAETPADVQTIAVKLTEAAMQSLGGMSRFVSKGDVVWLKPNIGWNSRAELAANTNPDVVATLARLCFEAGAKQVKVGDNTCNNARQTYRTSGIAAAAKQVGADMVYLDERRFKDVSLQGAQLATWPLYPEILEADLLINIPIVKHHGLSRVSLGMKNYMGIIGGERSRWHQNLPACLVDITTYLQPRLTVLDAVRVLTAHGPRGGNPNDVEQRNVVAAGVDIVAVDAFGAELLGHTPAEIATVRAGFEAGLGQLDYRSLSPTELVVS
jgi:uncharacterized protein (DUF362 family)